MLDVLQRDPDVAFRSVFKQSGWVQRQLSLKERLRAFDFPVWLYSRMRKHAIAQKSMERGISSLVVASVFRAMWAESGLGGLNELNSQPTDGDHQLPPGMKGKEDEVKHRSELGDSAEAEDNKAGSEDCPSYHTN